MKVIYEPRGRAAEYSPLACNLYRGCAHGCTYCYVPDIPRPASAEKRAEFHAEPDGRPVEEPLVAAPMPETLAHWRWN